MTKSTSLGSIAQADDHKYYDEIDLQVMIQKLTAGFGTPEALVAAATWSQTEPFIVFHMRHLSVTGSRRTKGVHNGR